MLFSCGHAISQIHMVSFSWSSSIKSGLLDVVVFRKLNSKSQINFACAFSRTCPLNNFSLYHLTSLSTSCILLAKQLPESLALCCHLPGTHYLPTPYIQPKDPPLFLFVQHTTCIYCTHLVPLSLSTLLFPPFIQALTLSLLSSWELASVQAINYYYYYYCCYYYYYYYYYY